MVRGVHKIYLSAILDLYDRRIVSYVISDHNDNPIVFDTFKATVKANPDAHPLFHSDRGFQYTNQTFHHMLDSEPGYFRPERGRVHWQQSASRDSPRQINAEHKFTLQNRYGYFLLF